MFGWLEGFFFVDDGWWGVDKLGHFFLHFCLSIAGYMLGCTVLGVALYDTSLDILTEFMHAMHWKHIGFSVKDVLWGRIGFGVATLLWIYFINMAM